MSIETLYDIPNKPHFTLAELEKMGYMNRLTALKNIKLGKLPAIKIMSK